MKLFCMLMIVNCWNQLLASGVCRRSQLRMSASLSSKAPKTSYLIGLLSGDGIGPEIMQATLSSLRKVSQANGFQLSFMEGDIGGIAIDKFNNPFPPVTEKLCSSSDSVLLSCIGGYKWDHNPRHLRPESGLLRMRKAMGLFANLRPAKVLPQLISSSTIKADVINGVDIMVVRELTGGIYFGTPKGIEVDSAGQRRGYSTAVYTEAEIRRIATVAMEVAMTRTRRVCSVDKANVLDVSHLWRDVVTDVAKDFPAIELTHMYVDNCAMQLIRNPRQFDTLLCSNMFGDILSDEASMLVGSLGMLPSASLGDATRPGLFEPCHGSAPDIAGQDVANPLAQILSAAMMLRYDLAQHVAADQLERAVLRVLDQGFRTQDIFSEGCTLVGCQRMGEEVVKALD